MKKELNKTHLNSDYMRKAYYELSDQISRMKQASKKLQNDEISSEVKTLEEALESIHLVLEKNYIWD